MNRPWQVWLIFAVCAVIVLTAMGWLSGIAAFSDWRRSQAEWNVQREQQVSLALWRMDTKLAPLIAEEAARPARFFQSFLAIESGSDVPLQGRWQANWTASPLLKQNNNVFLNFDNRGAGNWTSPQVPDEKFRQLALENGIALETIQQNRQRLAELAEEVDLDSLLERLPKEEVLSVTQQLPAQLLDDQELQNEQVAQQIALPQAKGQQRDYEQRSSRYQGAAQQEFAKQRSSYGNAQRAPVPLSSKKSLLEGLSRPLWVNDHLLLARRIVRDGQVGVQGSWLDWPSLKQELLVEVAELFPNADLKPLVSSEEGDPARMLAGLPVELWLPWDKGPYRPASALLWTLGLGWGALLTALAAVAALLWGVLALSERRAAFVSSVTHELRTPLTTFRMYSDMLAKDMVPDAKKRHEYLQTLQREAERLTHLVENVLSYARLERGRGPNVSEQITAGELIERQQLRLSERAQQAGMVFEVSLPDATRKLSLTTDTGVVEQILFNLVDNSAKYASRVESSQIHCEVSHEGLMLKLTIRDHGPGFDKTRQARHPRPFSKTSEQAAVSAPGVGLGLALCRRLATQLGGKLEIGGDQTGAAVTLALPLD